MKTDYEFISVEQPSKSVLRIQLQRSNARNALNNELRSELFDALTRADTDDAIRVSIVTGDDRAFSAGYDLKSNLFENQPYHTAGGLGNWPRHVVDGCFFMWDLAKPVIGCVKGYALAGGMELAAACDLLFVADDSQIGYPPVRFMSPPDNQMFPWYMGMRKSMYLMLTGDAMSGAEAVEAGFANEHFPAADLDAEVLRIAERVALIPTDLQQMNKRSVHRQMDIMGIRAALRAATELQALAGHTHSTQELGRRMREKALTEVLSERDRDFADYREGDRGE